MDKYPLGLHRAPRTSGKHAKPRDWGLLPDSPTTERLQLSLSRQDELYRDSAHLPSRLDESQQIRLSRGRMAARHRETVVEPEVQRQLEEAVRTLRAEVERREITLRRLLLQRLKLQTENAARALERRLFRPQYEYCSTIHDRGYDEEMSHPRAEEPCEMSQSFDISRKEPAEIEATMARDAASVASDDSKHRKPSKGVSLSLSSDKTILSDFQILLRESLEFFQVHTHDLVSATRRKKVVKVGQVGIRCRYCSHRPRHWQGRGAVYYPTSLENVYQAAQNMGMHHFLRSCTDMPQSVKQRFDDAQQKQKQETRRSGGKKYWTETSRNLGLEERPGMTGVWFKPGTNINREVA